MGKKSPPKEKDYTRDRARFAESEYAKRQQQAAEYNAQVSDYNQRLNNYLEDYNNLSGQINNLSIVDDEKFGAFSNQVSDLQRLLTGSQMSAEKPFFDSMVQSPYGAVAVGVPQLSALNTNAQNTASAGLTSLASKLNLLKDQRRAEEARIKDFSTGLIGQLAGVGSTLQSLGIGNKNSLDALRQQLDAIDTQRSTFSSDILSEVLPGGFVDANARYDQARAALADLYGQRDQEVARIEGFRSNLQNFADNFRGTLGGLSIADETGLEELQRAIDAAQLDANRFTSDVGFNFQPSLMEIQDIENQLGGLRSQRASELARIAQATNLARTASSSLESQLGNLDIYNLSSLNNLQNAIDQAQGDISDFTSDLPFDFGQFSTRLDSAEQQLADLFGQRNEQLGGFRTDLNEVLDAVNAANLWDEDVFRSGQDDLASLLASANRFAGQDANALRFEIEDAINAAGGRLEDLGEYRTGFEGRAQDFLDAVKAMSFRSMDDFNDPRAQLEALQAELEQYGATQASDELAGIKSRLDSERARLAQDIVNSSTASPLAETDVARMLREQTSGPMTVEQYLAFLQSLEEEENNPANTGFSRNLGTVIRL